MDAENKKTIGIVFFKEGGKYYTGEKVEIPDASMQVFEIADWLRANVPHCRGMHLVAMLDELDHGYPIMIPASERG